MLTRLVRHSQRLERLQEDRRTFLAYVTHHVHGPLEPGDAGFDVEIGFLAELGVHITCDQTDELQVQVLHLLLDVGRGLLGLALSGDLKHVWMLVLSHVGETRLHLVL